MPDEIARDPPFGALVEKNPHAVVSRRLSFAASRKPTTCSRVTDGKPARKSSIYSPAWR
jgi:hypothetical protein